ncbi:MAG TPA: tRNA (adenosine(37)-N6)-threonylcarbamoyltransferase complex ATPase subunit type 1 TsaE [Planctomicrobium sp.]|nr:tRNA (adenosine(37)-N6)-threonylcarbamoyltransferase complex ATPase subunit type 1 TsaE [Planctomicrobium sp.]
MFLTLQSDSLDETRRIGRALADCLDVGDVVALDGDLGAGKTHLVQAIADGLQVTDDVHSPTFVLIQEYDGRIPVCHIDAYRLNDIDEFLELGADELVGGDCVSLIEWANRVEEVLPRDRLTIRIGVCGETSRTLAVSSSGSRSLAVVTALVQRLGE